MLSRAVESHMLNQLSQADRRKVQQLMEKLLQARNKCAYPCCTHYRRGSKAYCCAGCSWDHESWKERHSKPDTLSLMERPSAPKRRISKKQKAAF